MARPQKLIQGTDCHVCDNPVSQALSETEHKCANKNVIHQRVWYFAVTQVKCSIFVSP